MMSHFLKSYLPKIIAGLISIFLLPLVTFGQEVSESVITIAESLAENSTDNEEASLYFEKLSDLSEDPIKINSADEDEISRLFFLSAYQVKALADYVKTSGKMMTVYEISMIPGFDQETAQMIIPFITLDDNTKTSPKKVQGRNIVLSNFTLTKGKKDSVSIGSPIKSLVRYRFNAGGFTAGFTSEKDAGEKLFSGCPSQPDFFSAFLSYSGNNFIKRIIIGDFSARYGLGTNINTGLGAGLSLTSEGYMPSRNEIRPYTSSDENKFFRGIASEFSVKKLTVSLFFSSNRTDATVESSDSLANHITGFYTSGVHNTPSSIIRKDAVRNIAYGANVSYNLRRIKLGFAWSHDELSLPIIKENGKPSDIYDFQGNSNDIYSFYYNAEVNKLLLYGEISANKFSRYAIVQGITMKFTERLTVNGLFRSYKPGFSSLHGWAPGTGSTGWNGSAIMANFSFEAAKSLFISGGCDFRNYPWLKYQCSSPSSQLKQEIRLRYVPAGLYSLEMLYSYQFSETDDQESLYIPTLNEKKIHYLRGSFRYSPDGNLVLTSRIDYKMVSSEKEEGALILQDIAYTLKGTRLTFYGRYCLFGTDSWDSRLFTYENDLLNSFSIPALNGQGSRTYVMIRYKNDFAEVRLKYGNTSVKEKSKGKEDFRLQIRFTF
jgi:hypothetical protein